jgi:hypothetical protein
MSDWLTDLLARAGEPIPCYLCGTPTRPADLTETTIPVLILDFGVPGLRANSPDPVTLSEVIWVCPQCPLPGGPPPAEEC